MSDNGQGPAVPISGDDLTEERWEIERAVLNESAEGREIVARWVAVFGDFIATDVRPVLRRVAEAGEEPQLLVNGLAELMRSTAESIEFPLDHPRAGSPS